MFSVQDKPGALFSALAPFKDLKINMSKIESRHRNGRPGSISSSWI